MKGLKGEGCNKSFGRLTYFKSTESFASSAIIHLKKFSTRRSGDWEGDSENAIKFPFIVTSSFVGQTLPHFRFCPGLPPSLCLGVPGETQRDNDHSDGCTLTQSSSTSGKNSRTLFSSVLSERTAFPSHINFSTPKTPPAPPEWIEYCSVALLDSQTSSGVVLSWCVNIAGECSVFVRGGGTRLWSFTVAGRRRVNSLCSRGVSLNSRQIITHNGRHVVW